MRKHPRVALVAVFAAVPALAQSQFHPAPVMPLAGDLVFDSRRNAVVVTERTNTGRLWHWNGSEFREQRGPSHAFGALPAYDPVLGEIHTRLNYGISTWNGVSWRTSPVPTTWSISAMAFDVVRRRLVATLTNSTDIAEWDGANWVRIAPTGSPGYSTQLCFDPIRGACVLAAGSPTSLWSWDGVQWTLAESNVPTVSGRLLFDEGGNRLVLHGSAGSAVETWVRAPSGWQSIASPAAFSNQAVSLAFDGTGILRIGAFAPLPEGLWRLQNNAWQPLPMALPTLRTNAAVASSSARTEIVMFGGGPQSGLLGDTWTFVTEWRRATPAVAPPPRWQAAMAWSPNDQAYVLFGGRDAQQQLLGDTWTWDGTVWLQRTPATSPPPAARCAMATDPAGGVTMLGGQSNSGIYSDHWRWSAGGWTNLGPEPFLNTYVAPLVAHDATRNRVVALRSTEAWEWDGAVWSQLPNLPTYPGFNTGALVFRPDTQSTLFLDSVAQPMEWNGAQWSPVAITMPYNAPAPVVATDFLRSRVRSLQHRGSSSLSSPWNGCDGLLTATPAEASGFGYGCALGAAPGLLADGRPRAGDAGFALAGTTFVPGGPSLLAIGFPGPPQPLGAGCVAWVAQPAAVNLLLADADGRVRHGLPLPGGVGLLGVEVTAQLAAVDPSRSLFAGLTFSAGLSVTIGE